MVSSSGGNAAQALRSKEQAQLLDIVDDLRSIGIDRVLSIPQLVVCGDQSSGKSSVLEAIAEIPFPRKENLCTRFATEIIMRRKRRSAICCEVIKHDKDTENIPIAITELGELASVIEQAAALMGLEDIGKGAGAFSRDVLRITVEGPSRPQLTLVDLPGLIHSQNKLQTEDDVQAIADLVAEYIRNTRTIILPVISAKNDIANQVILDRVRRPEVDPEGRRTLGVITKPDCLPRGSDSERDFLELAKNENVVFALGWHVLRNRDSNEMSSSYQDRNAKEEIFFETSQWASELPAEYLGVGSLRTRLSNLLVRHIKTELPSLREDLSKAFIDTRIRLEKLGKERYTLEQQRRFLYEMSNQFSYIARDAVNGHYDNAFFREVNANIQSSYRLCALVAKHGLDFAKLMRLHAHKYRFTDSSQIQGKTMIMLGDERVVLDQEVMNSRKASEWVKNVLVMNRGTELIGSYNPMLVGELYQIQSQNWKIISEAHLRHIVEICDTFCKALLAHVCPDKASASYLESVIDDRLMKRATEAQAELCKLLQDERAAPMTFNHYYTMTIQKERSRKRKRIDPSISVEKRQKSNPGSNFGLPSYANFNGTKTSMSAARTGTPEATISDTTITISSEDESNSDSEDNRLDMDEHSGRDALDALNAYYKVARKTFIDNVEKQVIRRHVMSGLEEVFSPLVTAEWNDDEVRAAAGESSTVSQKRKLLEETLKKLEAGQEVLKKAARNTD